MARLRLTADCGSCSFHGYYQISRTLRGQVRSAIKKKSGSPGLRMSAEVSRITFFRARLQFFSTALFLDGPPKKAQEGSGSAGRAGLNHSFQNLQKTKNALCAKALLVSPCCRAGATPLGGGGLFFSWHPCLPHPRI